MQSTIKNQARFIHLEKDTFAILVSLVHHTRDAWVETREDSLVSLPKLGNRRVLATVLLQKTTEDRMILTTRDALHLHLL